ncbi:Pr6Pr family membrane protein [Mycetocola sp. 2940]|uniref:Pr6Pr family membrane protein n=1 Tax=Mycetocola sp. 2940 TaxID=3156452 RepID=UPI003396E429
MRLVALGVTVWALLARTSCFYIYGTCVAVNVLSYFTIQSHVIMSIALVLGVTFALRRSPEPPWLSTLRLLATTYVVVSGGIFALLIVDAARSPFLLQASIPTQLLHFILPVYAVWDFVVLTRDALPFRTALLSLGFPVVWAAYTLVRGPSANWYPYFFLDPDEAGGYGMISFYALGLSVVILAVAFALVASTRIGAHHLPSG